MLPKRPAVNHQVMHQINRAVLLDIVRKQPATTRAKLSDLTGLTRSAISNLVEELMRSDMIREVGQEESTVGRRGILLALNPDGGSVIAVKFNASSVQCALVNLAGGILWHDLVPLSDTDQAHVLGICRQLIERAMLQNDGARSLLGIGVAAPGLINNNGDMIYSEFMNWRDVSFRVAWQAEYGVPVSVDNLCSLAALGESRFGSAIADSHFVYIEIGYGAGAGIVINHQIYQGKNGMAGEVGYLQTYVDDVSSAPTDWQELVNIPNFLRIARRLIDSGCQTDLKGADLSFGALIRALRMSDPAACSALSELCRHLGMGLASLYNAFDIPVFILGGELGREYAACLQQLVRDTERFLVAQPPGGLDLRISRMQPDASLMGAAARVFDTVLIEPSLPVNI
ncbi:MAG: ROK family protein [Chloroflexi bacterium]|nr:ROK family protein [Chloroflexota bacterium]